MTPCQGQDADGVDCPNEATAVVAEHELCFLVCEECAEDAVLHCGAERL